MRYRLTIEYDGHPFAGWQQPGQCAFGAGGVGGGDLPEFSGERVTVQGSGRTDAGVHALGQAAHFDLVKEFANGKVRDALNHHLKPAPVAVLEASVVSEEFSARFSAKARHYLYRILCRRAPAALDAGRVWHVVRALDADAMHRCRAGPGRPA